jgi:hypothetical protein
MGGRCHHQSDAITDVLQTGGGGVELVVSSINSISGAIIAGQQVQEEKLKQEKEPAPLTPENCDIVDKDSATDFKLLSPTDISVSAGVFSSPQPLMQQHSQSGASGSYDHISKLSGLHETFKRFPYVIGFYNQGLYPVLNNIVCT